MDNTNKQFDELNKNMREEFFKFAYLMDAIDNANNIPVSNRENFKQRIFTNLSLLYKSLLKNSNEWYNFLISSNVINIDLEIDRLGSEISTKLTQISENVSNNEQYNELFDAFIKNALLPCSNDTEKKNKYNDLLKIKMSVDDLFIKYVSSKQKRI